MKGQSTTLSLFRDLIAFPSVSRDPNLDLIDYCAGFLRSIGATVHIITAEEGRNANLYATILKYPFMKLGASPTKLTKNLISCLFAPFAFLAIHFSARTDDNSQH